MLVLELKKGQEIILTDRISKSQVVIKSNGNRERVELCFDAPRTIEITRRLAGNNHGDFIASSQRKNVAETN